MTIFKNYMYILVTLLCINRNPIYSIFLFILIIIGFAVFFFSIFYLYIGFILLIIYIGALIILWLFIIFLIPAELQFDTIIESNFKAGNSKLPLLFLALATFIHYFWYNFVIKFNNYFLKSAQFKLHFLSKVTDYKNYKPNFVYQTTLFDIDVYNLLFNNFAVHLILLSIVLSIVLFNILLTTVPSKT
jgi:NADH:ubiquinone oxidoreductase subunit 6 (subunit J)